MNAVNSVVYDSNVKVLNKFMDYVEEHVEDDSSLKWLKKWLNEFQSTMEVVKITKKGKREKGKRAPTTYNMFMSEMMKKFKAENPSLTNKEVMTKTTAAWKEMSADDKEAYKKSKTSDSESDIEKDFEPEKPAQVSEEEEEEEEEKPKEKPKKKGKSKTSK
jgi:hypothetical protein